MHCTVSASTGSVGRRRCPAPMSVSWTSTPPGSNRRMATAVGTVFRCVASRNRERVPLGTPTRPDGGEIRPRARPPAPAYGVRCPPRTAMLCIATGSAKLLSPRLTRFSPHTAASKRRAADATPRRKAATFAPLTSDLRWRRPKNYNSKATAPIGRTTRPRSPHGGPAAPHRLAPPLAQLVATPAVRLTRKTTLPHSHCPRALGNTSVSTHR